MAKAQSFGDKVRKSKEESRKMAKLIVAVKKDNGHYSFQQKMVDAASVKDEIKASRP